MTPSVPQAANARQDQQRSHHRVQWQRLKRLRSMRRQVAPRSRHVVSICSSHRLSLFFVVPIAHEVPAIAYGQPCRWLTSATNRLSRTTRGSCKREETDVVSFAIRLHRFPHRIEARDTQSTAARQERLHVRWRQPQERPGTGSVLIRFRKVRREIPAV